MEALKVSAWNDDRLDELSDRTDAGFEEVKGEIQGLQAEMQDGFARVDQEFKDVRTEMRGGFARVDERFEKVDQKFEGVNQEFKAVRQEMKEGFAQTVTRDEMNERFNAVDKRLGDLTRWVQVFVVFVGGAFLGNGLLG